MKRKKLITSIILVTIIILNALCTTGVLASDLDLKNLAGKDFTTNNYFATKLTELFELLPYSQYPYFTKAGNKSCNNSECDNCMASNVAKSHPNLKNLRIEVSEGTYSCYGFAKYAYKYIFGIGAVGMFSSGEQSSKKNALINIGTVNLANYSDNNSKVDRLRKLMKKGKVCDIIQTNHHSMIFLKSDDNGVYVLHNNYYKDKYGSNRVLISYITYNNFVNVESLKKIATIYRSPIYDDFADATTTKDDTTTSTSASCKHSSYDDYGKCKNCGKEYSMNISSMAATTYQVVKNDVPVRNRPYSPEKITKYLSKGTKVTVVASGKNSVGNLWYKLNDGSWIYSKNLEKYVEEAPSSTLSINLTQYPENIKQGKSFGLRGDISSNYKITSVKGYILNSSGNAVMSTSDYPNEKSVNIRYINLNEDMTFGDLSAGNYSLEVVAKDESGKSRTWERSFTVKSESNSSSSTSSSSSSSSKPTTSQSSNTSSTSIRFELESVPKGNLPYGKSFSLKGWFRSDCAIVEARAYMLDSNKNVVMQSDAASSTTSNYKIQGYKLDKSMKFSQLSPGGYYLKFYVRDANGDTATWISDKFYIVK